MGLGPSTCMVTKVGGVHMVADKDLPRYLIAREDRKMAKLPLDVISVHFGCIARTRHAGDIVMPRLDIDIPQPRSSTCKFTQKHPCPRCVRGQQLCMGCFYRIRVTAYICVQVMAVLYDTPIEQCAVVFSGGKGFHIELHNPKACMSPAQHASVVSQFTRIFENPILAASFVPRVLHSLGTLTAKELHAVFPAPDLLAINNPEEILERFSKVHCKSRSVADFLAVFTDMSMGKKGAGAVDFGVTTNKHSSMRSAFDPRITKTPSGEPVIQISVPIEIAALLASPSKFQVSDLPTVNEKGEPSYYLASFFKIYEKSFVNKE